MGGGREGLEERLVLPEPAPYRMAVGDMLAVRFFYYKTYDFGATVRPDGMITVPLIGEIRAAGMRPVELEEIIRTHYADVVAEPAVSVIVTEFANQRVFVFGAVGSPGAYPLIGSMTVLDAIAGAGDVKPSGQRDSIVLMRKSGDGQYVARLIDIEAKVSGRDTEIVYLSPTDIVYVPLSTIGKVDQFVDQFFHQLSPAWRFYMLGREAVNPEGQTIFSN
jgi:polysaccharide export outer membrane protein